MSSSGLTAPTPAMEGASALQAVRVAKIAHDDGQGTAEVRKILELARASFRAGDFEDTVRHAEIVLEILRGAPPPP